MWADLHGPLRLLPLPRVAKTCGQSTIHKMGYINPALAVEWVCSSLFLDMAGRHVKRTRTDSSPSRPDPTPETSGLNGQQTKFNPAAIKRARAEEKFKDKTPEQILGTMITSSRYPSIDISCWQNYNGKHGDQVFTITSNHQ
jgi:hypothetical protein